MLTKYILLLIISAPLLFAGCCCADSADRDFRTVPVTNNPHLIHDSSKTAQAPGANY